MTYTKISIVIKPENVPLYFIGSQIRGAFGFSLKKVTCINPTFKCDGCFATSNCLFYEFYEKKNIYHPYRLDFELGKDYYDFSFYIFNEACNNLPYIISAFHKMLTETGLGVDRITYRNFDIYVNDINCFENGKLNIPKEYIKTFKVTRSLSEFSIKFITPLRMKKNNCFIRDESLEIEDILYSIYQRERQLNGLEHERKQFSLGIQTGKKIISYKELTRYSNQQNSKMKIGGVMGEMIVSNVDEESYRLLKLGELIGVGKQTVFGLGKIKLEENI